MNKHPGMVPVNSPKAQDQQDEDVAPNSAIAESLKRRRQRNALKKGALSPDVLDEMGNPTPLGEQNAGN